MNKLKRTPSYGLGSTLLKKTIKFFPKLTRQAELKKAKELVKDENILLKAQDDMYNQYTSPEFKARVVNLINNRESKNPGNRYFDLDDKSDVSKFDKSSDYIIKEAERRLNPFLKGNQINYFSDKEAKLVDANAHYLPDSYIQSTKRIDPFEDLINRSKVKRTLTDSRKRFASIHELTHQATDADNLLNSNVKQELQKPFYLSTESPTLKRYSSDSDIKDEKEFLNYLREPTEIHARINQIRHELNPGNPYKKLEYSDIKTIKELKEGQRLVELIQDEKGFIDLMNKMYTPAAIAAAGALGLTASQGEYKKGGRLKYKLQFGGPLKHNNKAPDSFEAKFNTKLSKDVEEAYNRHTETFPQLKGDKWDYDTQGFYKEIYENNNGDFEAITKALTPGSPTAHVGTDKFKKPNHPTFSKESKYYIPILRRAGEWGKDENGKDQFKAVRRNIKNMDNDPLSYFKRAEDYDQDGTPDVSLLFRNKKLFKTGGSLKDSLPCNKPQRAAAGKLQKYTVKGCTGAGDSKKEKLLHFGLRGM